MAFILELDLACGGLCSGHPRWCAERPLDGRPDVVVLGSEQSGCPYQYLGSVVDGPGEVGGRAAGHASRHFRAVATAGDDQIGDFKLPVGASNRPDGQAEIRSELTQRGQPGARFQDTRADEVSELTPELLVGGASGRRCRRSALGGRSRLGGFSGAHPARR